MGNGLSLLNYYFMLVQSQTLEETLHGKLGDVVYYQRNGKTFTRRAPGSYNKIPTEKQAPLRERFKEAHRFAQMVIADPVLKALYNKKANRKCTAYSKAVSEYMRGAGL